MIFITKISLDPPCSLWWTRKKQISFSKYTANVYRLSRVKVSGTCVQPFQRYWGFGCLGVLGCLGTLGCLGFWGVMGFWGFRMFWGVWGFWGVLGWFGVSGCLWILGCFDLTEATRQRRTFDTEPF